jgi:hypothetical protein
LINSRKQEKEKDSEEDDGKENEEKDEGGMGDECE